MGGSNSFGTLLLLLAVVMLVFAFTRGRKQQREAAATQQRVAPGAEVMTTSGLFGTVVAVEDGVVTLETGPGQRSRWDKRAVARIVTPAPGPTSGPTSGPSTVQEPPSDAENPSGAGDGTPGDEHPPGRE